MNEVIIGKNCTIDCNSDSTYAKLVFYNEMSQSKLEVAVLEAKIEGIKKILKLIPRQICNRKLVARCKKDIDEAEEQLTIRKKELEYKSWLTEFWV